MEHDSQKGSIFALLCAVAVVFAIVNVEKVLHFVLCVYDVPSRDESQKLGDIHRCAV